MQHDVDPAPVVTQRAPLGPSVAVPRHRAGDASSAASLVDRRPQPRTVALVRDSWWYLGDVEVLAERLDANLLALCPAAGPALHARRACGDESLVTALLRCVDALAEAPDPLVADRQVRLLGQTLHEGGLPFVDLPQVGFALVRAVRERYTGQWSTSLGSAWTAVQTWVVEQLLVGAREVGLPALVELPELARVPALTDVGTAAGA